jgi:AraC-like DNA-binding protein
MLTKCSCHGDTAELMLGNLAKCLNLEIAEDNNEYCIDISEDLGSGYFRAIQFSHGVSVLELDVFLHKPLHITFENEKLNVLRLLFNNDNSIKHTVTKRSVGKLQRLIFSNGVKSKQHITISKLKHTAVFIININRKLFEKKIDQFASDISEELALVFKDLNGVNHVSDQDYFSLEISGFIEQFKTCELDEFMKPVFLEGKVYEILTYQIQKYSDDLKGVNKDKLLRKATIEKIEKAVDIIKKELDMRINVHKLAKRVGLNQNTLQSGFKTLFDTSVNEYIKTHKLELAKQLLEKSDLNVTEITYKIGINSRSYFSKLFKARYGISPNEYLTQIRDQKSA